MSAPNGFIRMSLLLVVAVALLSACGGNSKVISTFEGGTITEEEFQGFKGVIEITNPYYEELKNEPEFEKTLLQQLIAVRIIYNEADSEVQKKHQKEAEEKVEILKQDFLTRADDKKAWGKMLKESNTSQEEMVQYFKHFEVMQEKMGQEISDQELKEQYDLRNDKNEFDVFTLNHIFIATRPVGQAGEGTEGDEKKGTERTKEEALEIAAEVISKLEQGDGFTEVYEAYSDDPSTAQTKGVLSNITMAELPPQLSVEIIDLPVGGISKPIDAENGYHIVQVAERQTQSLEDVKENLRSNLISKKLQEYIQTELPDKIKEINL